MPNIRSKMGKGFAHVFGIKITEQLATGNRNRASSFLATASKGHTTCRKMPSLKRGRPLAYRLVHLQLDQLGVRRRHQPHRLRGRRAARRQRALRRLPGDRHRRRIYKAAHVFDAF
ncbi:jg1194 [Pararge aegeria aegeria]|uniref:Jg1194 protein n=1 Tax=Pararge aegeria aegeria TaxID=348720 RepID=A0A8S4QHC9_9NEOP|nr:jg1194 [Pararge aegeria aegeria]